MSTKHWVAFFLVVAVVVFGSSPVMAAQEISFQQFFDQVSSMEEQERAAFIRDLSAEQRKSLHEQFRALPDAERAQAAEVLLPGRTATSAGNKARAVATIQYDSGVAHPFRVANGNVVGNMFNTGFADPHTLTTVTVQVNGTFGGAEVEIFGAPAGSTAPRLTAFVGYPALGTPFALPIPNTTTPAPITGLSGTFLAGVAQSALGTIPSSTFRDVAVDVNDGGFGFHGMSIDPGATTGTVGTGFNPVPVVCLGGTYVPTTPTGTATTFSCTGGRGPFNAMVRMTGENLPVELMGFVSE